MYTILVIEDEEPVRENLIELLSAEGFRVIDAADGLTGLRKARAHRPSLILCDVMLPGMDGFEVLENLRHDAATASFPFVFLTARAEWSDVRKGMEQGADDYLTKPFSRAEVLRAIAARLAKYEAIAETSRTRIEELRGSITLALPHELLTPLNGIVGFSEILVEECESRALPEIRELADNIQECASQLHELILNVLFYSQLEIASRDPEYARTRLEVGSSTVRPIIQQVVDLQSERARRKTDARVWADEASVPIAPSYLEKIVKELVQNAFKFSPPTTAVHVFGRCQGPEYVLTVQDQGRGMSAGQIAELGAYMQFGRKRHEQQGAGLGLAIAKRVVDLHGGKMSIESASGLGTTVKVVLPMSGNLEFLSRCK